MLIHQYNASTFLEHQIKESQQRPDFSSPVIFIWTRTHCGYCRAEVATDTDFNHSWHIYQAGPCRLCFEVKPSWKPMNESSTVTEHFNAAHLRRHIKRHTVLVKPPQNEQFWFLMHHHENKLTLQINVAYIQSCKKCRAFDWNANLAFTPVKKRDFIDNNK